MPASEARIQANQRNSLRSTGPKTPEGKQRSRANGLKHGLTGAGVVLAEEDQSEVERRNADLQKELAPQTSLGQIMVRQMATLSVRMERSARQETAAISLRVRHSAQDFDQARLDEADHLLDVLGEDPRIHLRKLLGSPEGIDRLIEAWQDLRADLNLDRRPIWTAYHRERAENLTGLRIDDAQGTNFGAWSKEFWGDFGSEPDLDEDEPNVKARKVKARQQLIEMIDAEIADLEAHRETLDYETIEIDRREAGSRALFDPSREATLARRYESESTRGFFKALKELRRAEAEAAALAETRPEPPALEEPGAPLASSWEGHSPSTRRTPPPAPRPAFPADRPAMAGPTLPIRLEERPSA